MTNQKPTLNNPLKMGQNLKKQFTKNLNKEKGIQNTKGKPNIKFKEEFNNMKKDDFAMSQSGYNDLGVGKLKTNRKKDLDPSFKELTFESLDYVDETIKVPINVGDTVLGGRFKNKKIVVKDIGKDDKNQITINNKPLLKYRLTNKEKDLKETISNDKNNNNEINDLYLEEVKLEEELRGHRADLTDEKDPNKRENLKDSINEIMNEIVEIRRKISNLSSNIISKYKLDENKKLITKKELIESTLKEKNNYVYFYSSSSGESGENEGTKNNPFIVLRAKSTGFIPDAEDKARTIANENNLELVGGLFVGSSNMISKDGYYQGHYYKIIEVPFETKPTEDLKGKFIEQMIEYESGNLSEKDTLELFSHLIKSNMINSLQGHYGRMANKLMSMGYLSSKGDILKFSLNENKEKSKKGNPWAICSSKINKKENKEKYEKCVKEVKKQYNIKEELTLKELTKENKEGFISNEKSIAEELMKEDWEIHKKLNIKSGNDLYPRYGADPSVWIKYQDLVKKMLNNYEFNLQNKISTDIRDIIENENYHALNQAIDLLGYGEGKYGYDSVFFPDEEQLEETKENRKISWEGDDLAVYAENDFDTYSFVENNRNIKDIFEFTLNRYEKEIGPLEYDDKETLFYEFANQYVYPEEYKKEEIIDETTTSSSSGQYQTPFAWAPNKKGWANAKKRWWGENSPNTGGSVSKGGVVNIKDSCKGYSNAKTQCNSGDISNITITEDVKKIINKLSKEYKKPVEYIKNLIFEDCNKRQYLKENISDKQISQFVKEQLIKEGYLSHNKEIKEDTYVRGELPDNDPFGSIDSENVVDYIIKYENNELGADKMIELISYLIKSRRIDNMDKEYIEIARRMMIDQCIDNEGNILFSKIPGSTPKSSDPFSLNEKQLNEFEGIKPIFKNKKTDFIKLGSELEEHDSGDSGVYGSYKDVEGDVAMMGYDNVAEQLKKQLHSFKK